MGWRVGSKGWRGVREWEARVEGGSGSEEVIDESGPGRSGEARYEREPSCSNENEAKR